MCKYIVITLFLVNLLFSCGSRRYEFVDRYYLKHVYPRSVKRIPNITYHQFLEKLDSTINAKLRVVDNEIEEFMKYETLKTPVNSMKDRTFLPIYSIYAPYMDCEGAWDSVWTHKYIHRLLDPTYLRLYSVEVFDSRGYTMTFTKELTQQKLPSKRKYKLHVPEVILNEKVQFVVGICDHIDVLLCRFDKRYKWYVFDYNDKNYYCMEYEEVIKKLDHTAISAMFGIHVPQGKEFVVY